MRRFPALIACAVIMTASCSTRRDQEAATKAAKADSTTAAARPAVQGTAQPERVYWGDEHVHTGWSADAGIAGATLSPEDAVRFVRGEEVTSNTGQKAKINRPLDWVAVTDHSDAMGTINEIRAGHPDFMADSVTKSWADGMKQGGKAAQKAVFDLVDAQANKRLPKVMTDPKWISSAWTKTIDVMEKYNEPGKFTAFIAYEWTSNAGGGNNLHRNVILRDGADRARQVLPLTTFASEDPEAVWKWMAEYEQKTGGRVLAIPHNGNLSNGRMFEERRFDGSPLTRDYAESRARWEPLFELYQYKGQSEVHPSLSPTDEFAGYELWDQTNLNGTMKKPGMLRTEYWREALKSGMRLEQTLGANPFKIGAAAGTDTHTGLAAAEEDNFWGKTAPNEPSPTRWEEAFQKQANGKVRLDWTLSAMGYTGVWATANTREALWDAMKRRETYASTGPRVTVRFFGGWDFAPADAAPDRIVTAGYGRGVPMGVDLASGSAGQAPTFLVAAMKDPDGANLDRVQVIKGWLDAAGKAHERVFEVAWSDSAKRKLANGKLPRVGNTVDAKNASYANTIGAPTLVGTFRDSTFDAKQPAFWYVRVLEIPTPRWTAYDAKRYGVKMTPDVPMTTQERAVTSPIWYTPR